MGSSVPCRPRRFLQTHRPTPAGRCLSDRNRRRSQQSCSALPKTWKRASARLCFRTSRSGEGWNDRSFAAIPWCVHTACTCTRIWASVDPQSHKATVRWRAGCCTAIPTPCNSARGVCAREFRTHRSGRTGTPGRASDSSFLVLAHRGLSLRRLLLFEFFDPLAYGLKRLLEVLSLLLEGLPLLLRAGSGTETGWMACGVAGVRACIAAPRRPAVPGSAPAKTTSKAAPETAPPAPVSSATNRIRVARNRVTGAETRRSTCHRPHAAGTCTITTWHYQSPFRSTLTVLSWAYRIWGSSSAYTAVRPCEEPCAHTWGRHNSHPARPRTDRPCVLDHLLVP